MGERLVVGDRSESILERDFVEVCERKYGASFLPRFVEDAGRGDLVGLSHPIHLDQKMLVVQYRRLTLIGFGNEVLVDQIKRTHPDLVSRIGLIERSEWEELEVMSDEFFEKYEQMCEREDLLISEFKEEFGWNINPEKAVLDRSFYGEDFLKWPEQLSFVLFSGNRRGISDRLGVTISPFGLVDKQPADVYGLANTHLLRADTNMGSSLKVNIVLSFPKTVAILNSLPGSLGYDRERWGRGDVVKIDARMVEADSGARYRTSDLRFGSEAALADWFMGFSNAFVTDRFRFDYE